MWKFSLVSCDFHWDTAGVLAMHYCAIKWCFGHALLCRQMDRALTQRDEVESAELALARENEHLARLDVKL